MGRVITVTLTGIALALSIPMTVLAHVQVTPESARPNEFVVFSVSIPNERSTSVTHIRLETPTNLRFVTPTTTAGWSIETTGDKTITAIDWEGQIPVGQRAELSFQAQVPSAPTELQWKATQTYEDGTVVHWDQAPTNDEHDDEDSTAGPYSITTISSSPKATSAADTQSTTNSGGTGLAIALSSLAIVLSVIAITTKRQ